MRFSRIPVTLALSFASHLPVSLADLPYGAGGHTFKVNMQTQINATREYHVYRPESYQPGGAAVIFLHQGGYVGPLSDVGAAFAANDHALRSGYLAVYPGGTGLVIGEGRTARYWNAGKCCGYASQHNIDDIGFLRTMIDKLKSDFKVDASRVYVAGFSNGAMMAFRAACELTDSVAAIAAISGMPQFDPNACQAGIKRPVPTVLFASLEDGACNPMSPKSGMNSCDTEYASKLTGLKFPADQFDAPGIPTDVNRWLARNHIPEDLRPVYSKDVTQGVAYGPKEGAEMMVFFYPGGHWPPGGRPEDSKSAENAYGGSRMNADAIFGQVNYDLSATKTMWQFFQLHTMLAEPVPLAITGLYETILDRAPTSAEVDAAVTALKSGVKITALAKQLQETEEYRTRLFFSSQLVSKLFLQYLGRPAQGVEIHPWTQGIGNGTKTLNTLIQSIKTSNEYRNRVVGAAP